MSKNIRIVILAGVAVLALALLFGCTQPFWKSFDPNAGYIKLNPDGSPAVRVAAASAGMHMAIAITAPLAIGRLSAPFIFQRLDKRRTSPAGAMAAETSRRPGWMILPFSQSSAADSKTKATPSQPLSNQMTGSDDT